MDSMTDEQVHARISHNLPKLRGSLSLKEVGRRAGTSASSIKDIEEGRRMPGIGLATRICDAVGASFEQLLQPIKKSRRSA